MGDAHAPMILSSTMMHAEQLESSLPITLKCLSAVSEIAEPVLVALLRGAAIRKFRARTSYSSRKSQLIGFISSLMG